MNREITNYSIAYGEDRVDLINQVIEYIEDGYQPKGDVIVFNGMLHQIMVKYKPIEPVQWMDGEAPLYGGPSTLERLRERDIARGNLPPTTKGD